MQPLDRTEPPHFLILSDVISASAPGLLFA
jgi:hypothetical protein